MAKGLRVGVDFHTWDGIFQGSRSHILGIYKAAIRLNPEVEFYFFLVGVDSLLALHEEFGFSNVRLIRTKKTSSLIRVLFQLSWFQFFYKLDVLHTQYRVPLIPLGPTACTIHDILFETHPQYFSKSFVLQSKITFRFSARLADVLFTVSEFSKAELVRLYGVDPDRLRVTYNGVDRTHFSTVGNDVDVLSKFGISSKGYILNVGRLEPRKNQLALIEAWRRLGASAPNLVIVGQKDFGFQEVLEAIRSFGLDARIILLDKVQDDELPALFRNALIFAYPSYAEGFGMPVVEAMACGVPVVTSDTTSLAEIAGKGALTVNPESVDDLFEALKYLIDNERARADLVKASADEVLRFDWRESATVMMEHIRKAI